MDKNPRNEDDEKMDENDKSRLGGLGLDVNDNEEEEEELKDSKSGGMMIALKQDMPPDDDCCPICFDNFTIACCKTNCGHWFCAKCILQLWTHKTVLQNSCPICTRPVRKSTPEASLLLVKEVEVVEILKNVQRYNLLLQGGFNGFIQKVFEVLNLILRMLCRLIDPDRFRGNYYGMRLFAFMMSCIYNLSPFDFIPTGTLGARMLFDLCAVALVLFLYVVCICHRLVLRRRVRGLAGWLLYISDWIRFPRCIHFISTCCHHDKSVPCIVSFSVRFLFYFIWRK
ncbi:uncharacterized protein [Rutidosis leptorrhynchoides]|uniref:uncharacterized protein n=1 Tax=Rutidosis leptorrhynchoides TaxID=125765 RepID=UPI003A99DC09